MTHKVLLILLVVVMLLSLALLTACETADAPQPTATAKPATLDTAKPVTPVVVPTKPGSYLQPAGYP